MVNWNQRGMTLVELMVSTALFGILVLGMMTLFSENSKKVAKSQNESRLSEQLVEFSEAIENTLGNATQLISCACNPGTVGNCIFDQTPANPDCAIGQCGNPAAPAPLTLLRYEYEDAQNPSDPATNLQCVLGSPSSVSTTITPEGLILRGCKKRISLQVVQPVPVLPTPKNAAPGQLAIVLEGLNGAPNKVITTLSGVTSLRCGQLPLDPTLPVAAQQPSPEQFHLEIGIKTRDTNLPLAAPQWDGWHPLDAGFYQGTHRTISTDINFRNINYPGVHFGKAISFNNCTADGAPSPDGNCCSGYQSATAPNLCLAATACITSGLASTAAYECCSHKRINGSCL
ncbi:MAG: PilW family protein [Bdellovibrionota bacterium]